MNFTDGLEMWKRVCGKYFGENKACPYAKGLNYNCVTRLGCAYRLSPQEIFEITKKEKLKDIRQKYCNYDLDIDIESANRSYEAVYKQVMFKNSIPFDIGSKILSEIREVK